MPQDDQTPAQGGDSESSQAEVAESLDQVNEVDDYFGVSGKQSSPQNQSGQNQQAEEVNAEGNTADNETTAADNVQAEGEPQDTGDGQSQEENQQKDGEVYEVAGKEYKSFEEARDAVNRISGENTRLAGENKKLKSQVGEKDERIQELSGKLEEMEQYVEDLTNGEVDPSDTEAPEGRTVEDIVEEKMAQKSQRERQREKQQTHQEQLAEIEREDNFDKVEPKMLELANDLGQDTVKEKMTPKRLYELAEAELIAAGELKADFNQQEDSQDSGSEQTQTEAKKQQAQKIVGGNSRSNPNKYDKSNASKEVEDYFSNRA